MATSNAHPAVPFSQRTLLPQIQEEHTRRIPVDLIALYAGLAAACALWAVAAMNVLGVLFTPVDPGEASGWEPGAGLHLLRTARRARPLWLREEPPDGPDRGHREPAARLPARRGRGLPVRHDATRRHHHGEQDRYGLLTEEIKRWRASSSGACRSRAPSSCSEQRVPTPLVSRVVSIVTRANEAGGNVADVLNMVARNAREDQLSFEARKITMLTYVTVIYISFFVFLFTVLILAADFLPAMINAESASSSAIGSNLGGSASAGAVALQFQYVPELFLAFLVAVIAHAVGDGIMAGILHNARISDGTRDATILLAVGWLMMRYVVPPLNV